jgi:hypothetical protein
MNQLCCGLSDFARFFGSVCLSELINVFVERASLWETDARAIAESVEDFIDRTFNPICRF